MSKVIFFFSHVSNDIKADILMTYRTIYEEHLSKKNKKQLAGKTSEIKRKQGRTKLR